MQISLDFCSSVIMSIMGTERDELDSVFSPSISIIIAHWHDDDCEIITTGGDITNRAW